MLLAVVPHLDGKRGFKLRAAIGLRLHDLHKAIKAAPHAAMQKRGAMLGGQRRAQQNIGFATEDVHGGKGKQPAKVYCIHLHHWPWRTGLRSRTTWLILLPHHMAGSSATWSAAYTSGPRPHKS